MRGGRPARGLTAASPRGAPSGLDMQRLQGGVERAPGVGTLAAHAVHVPHLARGARIVLAVKVQLDVRIGKSAGQVGSCVAR